MVNFDRKRPNMALYEQETKNGSALSCSTAPRLSVTAGFSRQCIRNTAVFYGPLVQRSSLAYRDPDLLFPKTTDKWTPDIHRGRRDLAVRDIPAVWLVMCAKPGKLLASLASPPLVSSWWMAVVFAATAPVVTMGTARSKVLLLVPTGVRTWPGGFP